MRLRALGGTGIKVSPFCLGTMMFGPWGGTTYEDAAPVIHRALDSGVNFVDTADVYGGGACEEIVGRALKGVRDDVVLAGKVHYPMGEDANTWGNSRRWITRAVEDSLRRLGTDHLDLYQVHRPDPHTDIDETLGVLSDLVRSGKIRAAGSSTFPAEQIVEAQWVAERRGHVRLRTEQPPYSILNRSAETAVLPTCARYGMGVMTWSPLSEGWLTGRFQGEIDLTRGRQAAHRRNFDPALPGNVRKREAVTELTKLAEDAGLSLVHMSIAFAAAHPQVTSVILGARTMEQMEDLLAATGTTLDDALLDRIDEIVPPGTVLNPADSHYRPPAMRDARLRRRGHHIEPLVETPGPATS
ncbi:MULTISPECIES: aldo/keto reductase [Streptomonospora]|uniref:Aldo/keto reductase n=2 Tax=Streptomonospora TaxID=104204 RepID=A0ABV9SLL6_9ACTN